MIVSVDFSSYRLEVLVKIVMKNYVQNEQYLYSYILSHAGFNHF